MLAMMTGARLTSLMLILSIFYTATWARAHKRSQYFTMYTLEYKQSM